MLVAIPQLGISDEPIADPVEAPDNAPAPEALPMDQMSPEKAPSSQMAQTKEEANAALSTKTQPKGLARKAAEPTSKIAIQAAAPTSDSKPTPVEAQPDDKRSCRRLASDSVLP
jgi:hypothetical protein